MDFKLWLINESSLAHLKQSAIEAFPHTTKRHHIVDSVVIENISWHELANKKVVKCLSNNKYETIIMFEDNNNVKVRCGCPDFHWRFNYTDYIDYSLFGPKRKEYISKGVGPEANPTQSEGMCKHLMALMKHLGA